MSTKVTTRTTRIPVKIPTQVDVKGVRTEAGRVFYAGVGANDLAVAAVRGAVADVTRKAGARMTEVQADVTARVEARRKVDLAPKRLVGRAAGLVGAVAKDARGRYEGLAQRGEQVVTRLRAQDKVTPVVAEQVGKVAGTVSEAVDVVGERVAPVRRIVARRAGEVQQVVEPTVEGTETPAAAPRKTPAKKATTTTKATAKKAPAKKPAAKKVPATKTPTQKASGGKKAPVKKAPSAKAATAAPAQAAASDVPTSAPAAPAPATESRPKA